MKKVLIIESSPRKKGNSNLLCEEFKKGSLESGNEVEIINLNDKKIGFCKACAACQKNNGKCILDDDMADILEKFQAADVLVLSTPVYFYGITAQMKTFIDRTYPVWLSYTPKDVYYIVTAGLDKKIIERSIGDLDGFVDHLPSKEVKGRIYAPDVMDAGAVKDQKVMELAYCMGKSV